MSKILKTIGEGGCHIVYDTGDGNVIKKPKALWRLLCDYTTMAEDVHLSKTYFGEYLWPTRLIPDSENPETYVLVQPLLPKYQTLTLEMIQKNPELEKQLDDIIARNRALYTNTGHAFDFFGLEGMVEAFVAKKHAEDTGGIDHFLKEAFASIIADIFLAKWGRRGLSISNLIVITVNATSVLRIVDPTLTNERSANIEERIFAYCCNGLNQKYLERFFGK